MIKKNPFLKYIMKDKKEDVFHSSGYAKVQNGSNFGAASTETFRVRVNVNQHRQRVQGYKDSEIMTGTRNKSIKAKTYTPPEGAAGGDSASRATLRAAMPVKNPGISLKK